VDRARSGRLLAVSTVTLLVVLWGMPAQASHPPTPTHRVCIAHAFRDAPEPDDIYYAPGCTGHDEPELDPLSNAPGSAKDLTWTVVLPTDGTRPVSGTGIFWFGGVVSDPQSLFNQAFVELQFYPDTIVSSCTPYGGYHPVFQRDAYTACSPVWQINSKNIENAAFNAMLLREGTSDPLVMHAGDTVTVHFYTTAAADGFHETVQDLTTGQQGTIILDSPKHGPLMPVYDRQVPGQSLKWGIVADTPMSFVWEIGHTSDFARKAAAFCLPGHPRCKSYDTAAWAGISPITIESVVFGDGSRASRWGIASDYGGAAEVEQYCGHYGGPNCIYPWYSSTAAGTIHFGVQYPDSLKNFGGGHQYAPTAECDSPYGKDTAYCVRVINP
jgi:hypothetical protein